jgi:hypothetical protein
MVTRGNKCHVIGWIYATTTAVAAFFRVTSCSTPFEKRSKLFVCRVFPSHFVFHSVRKTL